MSVRKAMPFVTVLCLVLLVLIVHPSLRDRTRFIAHPDFSGVIFGRRAAARALESMLADDATKYWTPTRDDIVTLESRLAAHVVREHPEVFSRLPQYRRQYFEFTRRGDRRIFIVGFCEFDDLDWSREFVSAAEDSDCHFEADYDTVTATIVFFWMLG